uniref:Uncharacterized protein n=1 Tax=Glossina brevipalpis TaxID=37001 RepID=A0A1A9WUN2_9MUSC
MYMHGIAYTGVCIDRCDAIHMRLNACAMIIIIGQIQTITKHLLWKFPTHTKAAQVSLPIELEKLKIPRKWINN